jgi:hypothetical protein
VIQELARLGEIGHVRAIQQKLDQLAFDYPEHEAFVTRLRTLVDHFELGQFVSTLNVLDSYER